MRVSGLNAYSILLTVAVLEMGVELTSEVLFPRTPLCVYLNIGMLSSHATSYLEMFVGISVVPLGRLAEVSC